MSDIKVGDLVMYVRAHCEPSKSLGMIFTTTEKYSGPIICPKCEGIYHNNDAFWLNSGRVAPRTSLRKIPPLSELGSEKQRKELTA